MSLKDQLAADMENVFMNTDELADSVLIDGVKVGGFLLENAGSYDERVSVLTVADSVIVNAGSEIIIRGKTYGVVGDPISDGFSAMKIVLGEAHEIL